MKDAKTCSHCGQEKPLDEFQCRLDKGHDPPRRYWVRRCKDCERARLRAIMARKRAELQGHGVYAQEVLRLGRRKADQRAWARRAKGACAALRAAWDRAQEESREPRRILSDDERQEYQREYQRRRRREHPMRTAARRAVQRAVERGEMVKPRCCQRCGQPTPVRLLHGHHHHGYERTHRLDVRWLCVPCHVAEEGSWGAAA